MLSLEQINQKSNDSNVNFQLKEIKERSFYTIKMQTVGRTVIMQFKAKIKNIGIKNPLHAGLKKLLLAIICKVLYTSFPLQILK